jgi:hypothetical protein
LVFGLILPSPSRIKACHIVEHFIMIISICKIYVKVQVPFKQIKDVFSNIRRMNKLLKYWYQIDVEQMLAGGFNLFLNMYDDRCRGYQKSLSNRAAILQGMLAAWIFCRCRPFRIADVGAATEGMLRSEHQRGAPRPHWRSSCDVPHGLMAVRPSPPSVRLLGSAGCCWDSLQT